MNDERIREIQARCDVAAEGPWHYDKSSIYGAGYLIAKVICLYLNGPMSVFDMEEITEKTGQFIASSRQDIPYLLDALKAKDTEIARLKTALKGAEHIATVSGQEIKRLKAEIIRLNEVIEAYRRKH